MRVLPAQQCLVHWCGLLSDIHSVDERTKKCRALDVVEAPRHSVEHALRHLHVVLHHNENVVLWAGLEVLPRGIDEVRPAGVGGGSTQGRQTDRRSVFAECALCVPAVQTKVTQPTQSTLMVS